MKADDIISALGLVPLEMEGGLFRETYRSAKSAETPGRCCGTSIYYMLRGSSVSRWHKLASDEIWFFLSGNRAEQFLIFPDGRREKRILGSDIAGGEIPQSIVPAGTWQFTRLDDRDPNSWALFSTFVCPGFEYSDFTAGEKLPEPW